MSLREGDNKPMDRTEDAIERSVQHVSLQFFEESEEAAVVARRPRLPCFPSTNTAIPILHNLLGRRVLRKCLYETELFGLV